MTEEEFEELAKKNHWVQDNGYCDFCFGMNMWNYDFVCTYHKMKDEYLTLERLEPFFNHEIFSIGIQHKCPHCGKWF